MGVSGDAERRLVTVLYADLVGHTDLITRLDPEDWRGLLARYFDAVAEPIRRYGGTVEKFIGDAVFAVFGIPRAHEDDAARAVRAAVEMREALRRLTPTFVEMFGEPPALRIGIATGEAVAPAGAGDDRLVVGDLTALAERLQRVAPPNEIVLSERTLALVGPLVAGEPLGPLELKGFAVPQRAVLLRRVAADAGLLPLAPRTPLVNRERELGALQEAGERLRRGQGGIVFLVGEAGLGKSRLAAELYDRLAPATRFLIGRCHEFTQSVSHGVIRQLMRVALEVEPGDPPEVRRRSLIAALGRRFEPAPVPAALVYLLDPGPAPSAGSSGLTPEEAHAELRRAITVFWERVAQGPLVVLVEDLHWVDAASAETVRELFAVTERLPLLLLCAFRPERRSAAWDLRVAAEREYPHRYQEVRLGPLTTDETERLAAALLVQLTLPVGLKSSVARRAEGNPLYVEEVVRSLGGRGSPGPASVPDTLQGALQARLDALPPGARRVLQAAAVVGRTFPLHLLQVLVGGEEDLVAHLSTLQRADFLRELQRIPEPLFAFKHVLQQEATYQTLLRSERRDLHLRLAEELAGGEPDGETLALLAHHFRQGGAWARALRAAVRAGDAARQLGGVREALDHYDAALADAAAHRAEAAADEPLVIHAHLARSEALGFLGRYDEAERTLRTLLRRYRAPGTVARIHRRLGQLRSLRGDLRRAHRHQTTALRLLETDGEPAELAGAHRDLAHVLEMQRDYAGAAAHAGRALALAEAHGLRLQLRESRRILFSIHFYAGDLERSVRYAEATLAQALEDGDALVIARSRVDLANVLLFTGDLPAARQQVREAVELSVRLGLDVPLILAQTTLVQIHVEQGYLMEAEEASRAVRDLVEQRGLGPRWRAAALRGRALLSLARGDWSEAISQLEEAKAQDEKAGIARNRPRIHRLLAEAYLGAGNHEAARVHASSVRRLERGGGPIETPSALRILAVVARERGRTGRAARLLEEGRALMTARRQSGEYARTLLAVARTLAGMGRREEARRQVEEALAIYRRQEAQPLLEAAERQAAQF